MTIENPTALQKNEGMLQRTVTYGGNYWTEERGISLGCPLSPIISAACGSILRACRHGTGCGSESS